MSQFIRCNSTSDCVEADSVVLRFCFEKPVFSNETFICDCAVDYGWKGENCDEVSSYLIFRRCILLVSLLLPSFVLIVSLRTIILNYIYEGISSSSLAFTSYSVLASSICFIFASILTFPPYFDPRKFEFVIYDSIFYDIPLEEIDGENILVRSLFQALGIIFLGIGSIFLILSWQEIFLKISVNQSYHDGRRAIVQGKRVIYLSAFMMLTVLVFIFLEDIFPASAFSVSLAFSVAVFYGCVSQRFINSLAQVSSYYGKEEILEITISFVCRIKLYLIVCLVIVVSSLAIFIIFLLDSTERTAPGDFDIAYVATDIAFIACFIQLVIVAWYVNSVSVGPIVAEEYFPKICWIFAFWDKMNSTLIPENANTVEESVILSSTFR